jgi:hypothetical protein
MKLIWMSFCDGTRPKGEHFLGACIVEIAETGDPRTDSRAAITRAWEMGCNPGGEVMPATLTEAVSLRVGPKWKNRLLTRTECEEFDREMSACLN